ncbi:MAG: hypothetical protein ACOYLB_00105 [Phototrophicaceae bacterium]
MNATQFNQLLSAIDLVEQNQKAEARTILRSLLQEDGNAELVWLWMSVVVEDVDQSALCLDNVLRINPHNHYAGFALSKLRELEARIEKRRQRLIRLRSWCFVGLWLMVSITLFMVVAQYSI